MVLKETYSITTHYLVSSIKLGAHVTVQFIKMVTFHTQDYRKRGGGFQMPDPNSSEASETKYFCISKEHVGSC